MEWLYNIAIYHHDTIGISEADYTYNVLMAAEEGNGELLEYFRGSKLLRGRPVKLVRSGPQRTTSDFTLDIPSLTHPARQKWCKLEEPLHQHHQLQKAPQNLQGTQEG